MSRTTTQKDAFLSKIDAQINEEKVFKGLGSVQLSRIHNLESLIKQAKEEDRLKELTLAFEENLHENVNSLSSHYVLGVLELEDTKNTKYLQSLLQDFTGVAKWTIVEHLSDLLIHHDPDSRVGLRSKIESTEQLKGKKEARPYIERLAKIDRKNPDILRKYAMLILEDDATTALRYLKQAGETYARLKDHKNLQEIWQLIIKHDHKDMAFFERIERLIISQGDKLWISSNLAGLLDPFQAEEDWTRVVHLLKKIIEYEPNSSRYRSELIKAYRNKYKDHSLLEDFLKMSGLTDTRKAISPSVANFEHNIVFDKDNYVYHRKRGVGKILQMDSQEMIVDFNQEKKQKMSIQMAISSLQPLQDDHIWIRNHKNPEEMEKIFQDDPIKFFQILVSSFGNKLLVARIKKEVTGNFIDPSNWTKWWSKVRAKLKKDPNFGFNPYKRDELILREISMSFAEELTLRFQAETNWDKKLDLAIETIKDPDLEDAALVAIQFYKEQEQNKSSLKKLHSFLLLECVEEHHKEKVQGRSLLRLLSFLY